MSDKHLHIVTHIVPWPADIGGVIDIFYKIKTLHQLGVCVHLHCFTYNNRLPQDELSKYCASVHYYPRRVHVSQLSLRLPFIVNSRRNDRLLYNLQQDNYPILMEGVHTTYYLMKGFLNNRRILVRLFNAEFEYYRHLSAYECNPFKRFYFKHESKLLKKYEQALAAKATLLALSQKDISIYKNDLHATDIRYLPAFLPYSLAVCKEGNGCCFCLYHGNLSVNENEKAVEWLLQQVFSELNIPFIVAGKNPTEKIRFLVQEAKNACLVANPDERQMQDLIAKAQINVLPSFNNTGIKLKLLNALFNGKHCVANHAAVEGSGLDEICHFAEEPATFRRIIRQLYKQPFEEEEIQKRQGLLQQLYNNEANARQLISWLW